MIIGISPWVRSFIVMMARIATIRPGARGRVPPGPALSYIRRSNILMINIMTSIYLNRLFIDIILYIPALVFFNFYGRFSIFPSNNNIIYIILFSLIKYLSKFPSNLNFILIRKVLTSSLTPLNFFRSGSFSKSLGNNYKVRISNGFF